MLSAYKFRLLLRALETSQFFGAPLRLSKFYKFKKYSDYLSKDLLKIVLLMSVVLIFKSYKKLKGFQHFAAVNEFPRYLPQECLNFLSLTL